jgi:hypothetical protein
MHFRKKLLPTVSIEASRDPDDQDGSSPIDVEACDLVGIPVKPIGIPN